MRRLFDDTGGRAFWRRSALFALVACLSARLSSHAGAVDARGAVDHHR